MRLYHLPNPFWPPRTESARRPLTKRTALATIDRVYSFLSKVPDPKIRQTLRGRAADVFLLDRTEMRDLKMKSGLAHRAPLHVLAFPEPRGFPRPPGTPRPLGEIYLSSDIARSNPGQFVFLFVHGLLHLLGYDHKKNRDSIEMETLEKRLWLQAYFLV